MIIQLCVAYCIIFPPYDFTLVLESDCTFEQVLQPSPGEPVCSDIFKCRRSLIKISLTVFTKLFYKYRTVRLNLLSVLMLLTLINFYSLLYFFFYSFINELKKLAHSKRLTIVSQDSVQGNHYRTKFQDQRAFRLNGAYYSG